MPLQSSMTGSGSEESEATPSDKHKSAIMRRLAIYLAQTIGVSDFRFTAGACQIADDLKLIDDSRRIASIGYNANPIVSSETTAYFAGTDEHVIVINSPNLASRNLNNVVLLKAEAARSFQERGHVVTVAGNICVKAGYAEWSISVSGCMLANLCFKDKHCRNKQIHTVDKDTEDVEFWVLDHGAEAFPHDLFVTHEFTATHGLDGPVARALALSRKGLRLCLPEISDGE
ncbi:hypothetical protein SLS58_001884 [Diplodia intermedia]|uniref:Uncharacterized protein n=1 Tax=Diplodia intermedia TaxID=856260 RepID=A0ABR3U102_9PEZI